MFCCDQNSWADGTRTRNLYFPGMPYATGSIALHHGLYWIAHNIRDTLVAATNQRSPVISGWADRLASNHFNHLIKIKNRRGRTISNWFVLLNLHPREQCPSNRFWFGSAWAIQAFLYLCSTMCLVRDISEAEEALIWPSAARCSSLYVLIAPQYPVEAVTRSKQRSLILLRPLLIASRGTAK